MKSNQVVRLGATFAILLGLAKLLSGAFYLMLSPDLRAEVPAATFLPALAQNSTLLMVLFWVEALVGVLGVAVVPALSSLVQEGNEGLVRWAANLATAGFVVSSVGYTLSIAKLPGIAAAFVAGDPATKAALAAVWKSSIDLLGLWGYGAVGLWVFVVSWSAMRKMDFPKIMSYLGMLYGILFVLVPAGTIFKMQAPLLAAAVLGATLGPVWWIWTGMTMRRAKA
jgi:uncharacterized protein DUF4386